MKKMEKLLAKETQEDKNKNWQRMNLTKKERIIRTNE